MNEEGFPEVSLFKKQYMAEECSGSEENKDIKALRQHIVWCFPGLAKWSMLLNRKIAGEGSLK